MKLFPAILFSLVFSLTLPAFAQTSVSDSFESGSLDATDSSVFSWDRVNRTSLVKGDPQLGDMTIYNRDGALELLEGSENRWRAKDGNVSMRFDYPAGEGGWAEQRFRLGHAEPDIWIRYWVKVPDNFKHSSDSPSNNKLFALWMDDYSSKGDGPTVIWEFWNDGAGGSKLAYHYSEGGYQTANGHKQHTPFIRYPDDQGRWMQIVMHVKASSASSANDGVIELYRRWENEESFTLLHEDTNANIAAPSGGPQGWKAGYFMGWSNPGYESPTEWLLDDVTISSSSLLSAGHSKNAVAAPASGVDATSVETGSCTPPRKPTISKPHQE